jgi:hypothetical protein
MRPQKLWGVLMMREVDRTRLEIAACCVGVVVTGLLFENSVFSLSIAAALCIGSFAHGVSVGDSRLKAIKVPLLNAGVLALICALLRVTLTNVAWRFPHELWPWLHRLFRVGWLSEFSAIILALVAAGLLTVEVARKIGGDATRLRFQWSIVAAASVLVAVNIVHFLRPVSCSDCFFPFGRPFTLFTEGGFAGGGGFVWTGLVADAALAPAFATISTLLWNQIANQSASRTDRS